MECNERWVASVQASPLAGSGDCLCIVARADGRTTFFVGDVAGHDLRAAELAADLSARVVELGQWASPGALLAGLNAFVEVRWPSDVFVCAVCFTLDPGSGRGTIAVAGHFSPFVRDAVSCRPLETHPGPALGLVAGQRYLESDFRLDAGDVLVAVTDGVTDPLATVADPLGLAALARLLVGDAVHPTEVCASLMEAARRDGVRDDASVLAVAPGLAGASSAIEDIGLAA
jgi:serine phosphatase RsbU (regulator of sigma subunit)